MKSYLAKFQNVPAQAGISLENVLSPEPSKPSKLGFAGFDGSLDGTFSEMQGRHPQPAQATDLFTEALHDKPSKPSKLGFAGFDGSAHRAFQNNHPVGTCPHCHESANLQMLAGDVWFCPGCRIWMHGDGSSLAKIERPRAFTLERQEAERLAADLLTAGCLFVPDEFDGEWNVRLPVKISATLLTRFENAGRTELQRAIGELAELDNAKGWEN